MYNDVMEDQIEQAIAENSDANADHVWIERYLREVVKQRDRRYAEDNGKQVVLFQGVMMNGMMRPVPTP